MIVVKHEHLAKVSALAKSMNCHYSYLTVSWEDRVLCEIRSSSKLFLAMVKKNIMMQDPELRIFENL